MDKDIRETGELIKQYEVMRGVRIKYRLYCANCGRNINRNGRMNYKRCKCGHKRAKYITTVDRVGWKQNDRL